MLMSSAHRIGLASVSRPFNGVAEMGALAEFLAHVYPPVHLAKREPGFEVIEHDNINSRAFSAGINPRFDQLGQLLLTGKWITPRCRIPSPANEVTCEKVLIK
jgi:hypothetical protein